MHKLQPPAGIDPAYYTVANRDRGTNWKRGARIVRLAAWQPNGFAPFTDAEAPQVILHAHRSEVLPADRESRLETAGACVLIVLCLVVGIFA